MHASNAGPQFLSYDGTEVQGRAESPLELLEISHLADRSVDEMGHIRLGLTYFETEEEYQAVVDERERLLQRRAVAAAGQQQGQQ